MFLITDNILNTVQILNGEKYNVFVDMKDTRSGVYQIRNKINNKIYIGSTVNLYNRFSRHISALKNNNHRNDHLQRAWNKYGEQNFVFEIIEIVNLETQDIYAAENKWISLTNCTNEKLGYNIQLVAGKGFLGMTMSEESKVKMSKNALGENNSGARHDTKTVISIKLLLKFTDLKQKTIAEHFNYDPSNISTIHTGVMWNHINIEEYKSLPDKLILLYEKLKSEENTFKLKKLSKNDVIKIKLLLRDTKMNQREIANLFGITKESISRIKTNNSWKNTSIDDLPKMNEEDILNEFK